MTHEEAISVISNVAWLGNESDRKKIERAIKKLSESPTCSGKPNNWIPVSEGLPPDGYFLATTTLGDVVCAFMTGNYVAVATYEEGTNAELGEIIAWQPLPNPYKGEA